MTSLTIAGISLDKILAKHGKDIEELQKKADEASGLELTDEFLSVVLKSVMAALKRDNTYALEDRVKTLEAKHQSDNAQQKERYGTQIVELEAKLVKDFNSKIEQTQTSAQNKLDELGSDIEKMKSRLMGLGSQLGETNEKIDGLRELFERNNNEMNEKHTKLEEELFKVMKAKIADTWALCDGRLTSLEDDLFRTKAQHAETFESSKKAHADVSGRVEQIESTYATQNDVRLKADISLVSAKAESSDIKKMTAEFEGIHRHMDMFSAQVNETVKKMEEEVEAKAEARAKWVYETLKKEFTKADDGTDIGKIKCLVCDQTISQKTEVESNVFSGPGMTQVIKPQGQTREIFDDGDDEAPGVSVPRNPSRVRPASATNQNERNDYMYNRKLVSIGATPSNNLLTMILQQQQNRQDEIFEEERFQEEKYVKTLQAVVPVQHNYPPEKDETVHQDYFHGLQMKFKGTSSNGVHKKGNPLLAKNKTRPGTAPAQRSRR